VKKKVRGVRGRGAHRQGDAAAMVPHQFDGKPPFCSATGDRHHISDR
jgi:hypothetical protein